MIAAAFLELNSGFRSLGDFGVVSQLLSIVPAIMLAVLMRTRLAKQL